MERSWIVTIKFSIYLFACIQASMDHSCMKQYSRVLESRLEMESEKNELLNVVMVRLWALLFRQSFVLFFIRRVLLGFGHEI